MPPFSFSSRFYFFFFFFFSLLQLLFLSNICFAADPFVFFDWTVSYLTGSPLGDKQQVPYLLLESPPLLKVI